MRTKGICIALLLSAMAALTGCGGRSEAKIDAEIEEEIDEEALADAMKADEKTYPDLDAVAESLEDAGFTVERAESVAEAGVEAERVKAVKGEEYLDICYNIASDEDRDKIVEFYTGNYQKYNLVSDDEVVYCYSSEWVLETVGLN
ncbi:MAG: hypothetical protein NC302_03155 [Bacteroidales bacterium]|nr:hypothetical protein [Bacteroidales bacterium]MCM1414913.1 hypothetical protein [bacterium]MCM1423062.1 hypothetical protein [bacterium]